MTPQEISILIYNIAVIPVIFFSILFLTLSALYLLADRPTKVSKKLKRHPYITVQICSYNDPIATRCVEACLAFTYPKDRYEIMILDDSTDEKTQRLLKAYEKKHPGHVRYVHRTNREGYKPGALRDAHRLVKGEILAPFDADFIPDKDYLENIAKPFEDPKVAIVQTRQVFFNKDTNLVSRFATYMMMVYYTVIMPINNRANAVFFGGTAGALRKKAVDEAGGWNIHSITEDSDLSFHILQLGYKSVFLDIDTKGEAPITLEAFLKQQMRWSYGNFRVFLDYPKLLLAGKLKGKQKAMILFFTLGNLIAPPVLIMTVFGLLGWFFGDPQILTMTDLVTLILKIAYTAGFVLIGVLALYKRKMLKDTPQLLLTLFSLSIVLAVANSVALFRAAFMSDKPLYPGQQTSWITTPKEGNDSVK